MKRKKRLLQEGYADLLKKYGSMATNKAKSGVRRTGIELSTRGSKVGGGTGTLMTKAGGIMQRRPGRTAAGIAGGAGLAAVLAKRRKKKTVAQEAAIGYKNVGRVQRILKGREKQWSVLAHAESQGAHAIEKYDKAHPWVTPSQKVRKTSIEIRNKRLRDRRYDNSHKRTRVLTRAVDSLAGKKVLPDPSIKVKLSMMRQKLFKKKIKEAAISRIRPKNLIRGIGQRIARSGERRLFTGRSGAIKGTEMADLNTIMKSRAQMSKGTRLKSFGTILDKGAPAFEVAGAVGTGAAGYGVARRKIRRRRAMQTAQESILNEAGIGYKNAIRRAMVMNGRAKQSAVRLSMAQHGSNAISKYKPYLSEQNRENFKALPFGKKRQVLRIKKKVNTAMDDVTKIATKQARFNRAAFVRPRRGLKESVLRPDRTLKRLVGQNRKIVRKIRIGKNMPDWRDNKITIETGGQQARARKLIDDLKAMRDARVPSKIRRRVLSNQMKRRMGT